MFSILLKIDVLLRGVHGMVQPGSACFRPCLGLKIEPNNEWDGLEFCGIMPKARPGPARIYFTPS